MLKFFLKLVGASPLSLLPALDNYTIEQRPRKGIEVKEKRGTSGTVENGKEWKTEWHTEGGAAFTSQQVGTEIPASPNLIILDGYDFAYLDSEIGAEWRRDESRAKVIKWHWLQEMSAQKIQEYHTANGKLQRGYSERTAAPYIKAFYAADEHRDKDGKKRQRKPQNPTPPENVITWD